MVVSAGDGPTVVCAHGMLLDHRMFAPQLDGLSERLRVVAYDQRSRDGRGDRAYDLGVLAEDCAEVVRCLDSGPAVIAGMSMGGLIALRLALERPELVSGLVLIATSALPEPPAERDRLRAAFGAHRNSESLPAEFARAEAEAHFARRTRRLRPGLVREIAAAISRRSGRAAWFELNSWLSHDDLAPRLGELRAPVLIVHGDEDELVPVERALQTRELIPESRLLIVPYAGHAVNIEAPDVVNVAVAEFVQESVRLTGLARPVA